MVISRHPGLLHLLIENIIIFKDYSSGRYRLSEALQFIQENESNYKVGI